MESNRLTAMIQGPRLLTKERRRKILALLEHEERVTVAQLVESFGVSAVTARADLDSLAAGGALVRSHGGAIKQIDPLKDYPLKLKQTLHHSEKVRIGAAAAQLIHDNDRIILDSGTTTGEVARQIKQLNLKSLTVITNALNIAMELSNLPNVSVIMTGGILRHMSYSLVGPQAEQTLRDLNADHLFLGVDGLDLGVGLTTPDILEAQLNAQMMNLAREITVVADASKFGRRSLSVIGKIDDVDRVITDDRADADQVAAFEKRGIEVLTV